MTALDGALCGLGRTFIIGEEYLVYAYSFEEGSELWAGLCSRTTHISDAQEDLAELDRLGDLLVSPNPLIVQEEQRPYLDVPNTYRDQLAVHIMTTVWDPKISSLVIASPGLEAQGIRFGGRWFAFENETMDLLERQSTLLHRSCKLNRRGEEPDTSDYGNPISGRRVSF